MVQQAILFEQQRPDDGEVVRTVGEREEPVRHLCVVGVVQSLVLDLGSHEGRLVIAREERHTRVPPLGEVGAQGAQQVHIDHGHTHHRLTRRHEARDGLHQVLEGPVAIRLEITASRAPHQLRQLAMNTAGLDVHLCFV